MSICLLTNDIIYIKSFTWYNTNKQISVRKKELELECEYTPTVGQIIK